MTPTLFLSWRNIQEATLMGRVSPLPRHAINALPARASLSEVSKNMRGFRDLDAAYRGNAVSGGFALEATYFQLKTSYRLVHRNHLPSCQIEILSRMLVSRKPGTCLAFCREGGLKSDLFGQARFSSKRRHMEIYLTREPVDLIYTRWWNIFFSVMPKWGHPQNHS